jgi:hypothetical protein
MSIEDTADNNGNFDEVSSYISDIVKDDMKGDGFKIIENDEIVTFAGNNKGNEEKFLDQIVVFTILIIYLFIYFINRKE